MKRLSLFFLTFALLAENRPLKLQGELLPYQAVDLVARVPGFIDSINVDRGSVVKKGDVLAKLVAPELETQRKEAEAKVQAVLAQKAEVEAKILAAQSTYEKLKTASTTEGAIAGNEVILAQKAVDAAKAQIDAIDKSAAAAQAQVKAIEDLQSYLTITAPFDGVITERRMHPGALAGPSAGPILHLEQVNRLRLVIAVPEGSQPVKPGTKITFIVASWPDQKFTATVARAARTLDVKTRTMPVEADVYNAGKLAPGMYAEVTWPAPSAAVTR